LKKYTQTSAALFHLKVVRAMKKMNSELDEHRYFFERNVARRTEQLIRRIELLESCNANLCFKLAQSQQALAASVEKKTDEAPAKLYFLNSDVQRVA
jgi:hypothetical protein